MAEVIVITCYLLDAGYGEATFNLLADLLTLHELQMRSAPFHVVEKANRRLLESARALPADRADIHNAA